MNVASVLAMGVTGVKVCLLTGRYYSTDFLVHRNWLAITRNLPISKWYHDSTDDYNTLDYPPSFAYFEAFLSRVVAPLLSPKYVSPECFELYSVEEGREKVTKSCILFQRLSVIAVDLLFFVPAAVYCSSRMIPRSSSSRSSKEIALLFSMTFNAGLLLLDHMHFQYNAFVLSLLIFSVSTLSSRSEDSGGGPRAQSIRTLLSAVSYCILLTLKHLYLLLGPAFLIEMLSKYCFCFNKRSGRWPTFSFSASRFLLLGLATLTTVAIPFIPVVYTGPDSQFTAWDNLMQIKSRLFPFGRGLTHAYWAPNLWALYSLADRVLLKANVFRSRQVLGGGTSGLISDKQHSVLPNISANVCVLLILVAIFPVLKKLWAAPSKCFAMACACVSMTAFMLGYHVHEKAIMTVIMLLNMLMFDDTRKATLFLRVSFVGHLSLSPLLLEGGLATFATKYFLIGSHYVACRQLISVLCKEKLSSDLPFIATGVAVVLFSDVAHPIIFPESMQFLPLMVFSVALSFCNVILWYDMHILYFSETSAAGSGRSTGRNKQSKFKKA